VRQDETGFAEFYRASHQRCLRAVIAGAGRPDLAEDLVAEAFTRALVSWRTVRDHPAPEANPGGTAAQAGTTGTANPAGTAGTAGTSVSLAAWSVRADGAAIVSQHQAPARARTHCQCAESLLSTPQGQVEISQDRAEHKEARDNFGATWLY